MPAYIAIPAAIVLGVIFLAVAFGPVIWLTRSVRAVRFRHIRGLTLLLWWVAAIIPWAVVMVDLRSKHSVGISADGILSAMLALAAVIAAVATFVSLPLAVIVLTALWILDRRTLTR